ncbi:MAG TPA: hypothetical protein VGM43_11540 [Bryobacteraceae bacterium]
MRPDSNRRNLGNVLGNIQTAIDLSAFDFGSMEGALRWQTAIQWMENVLPRLQDMSTLLFCGWVAVLIPMSIFRRAHPLIARILRGSSLFMGGLCWWQSLIVTWHLLGSFAVSVGLLCAGVGVIPMALFATAVRGQWDPFRDLAISAILTLVPRIVAKFIAKRQQKLQLPATVGSYYSRDFSVW